MAEKGLVQPEKLPPTDRAAFFHGLRAHLQIVTWKLLSETNEINLEPTEWGWQMVDDQLKAITSDTEIAPENILKVIRCNCKNNENQCGTNRCSCRKNGLSCVTTCGECHGEECENKEVNRNNLRFRFKIRKTSLHTCDLKSSYFHISGYEQDRR